LSFLLYPHSDAAKKRRKPFFHPPDHDAVCNAEGKPFFILLFLSPLDVGSFVLAWKRGIAILTAGEVKVTPDPRVRLSNGYTLQIREAVPSDAGDYICQIGTLEPREITHHVEILSKKTCLDVTRCPLFCARPRTRTEKRYEQKKGCRGGFMMIININYSVPFQ
jgi:hypothetical protein